MSRNKKWTELEDWVEFYGTEKFYSVGSGAYKTLINFGGPGAAIDYHFYARMKKDEGKLIDNIQISGAEFKRGVKEMKIPRMTSGYSWVHLGFVKAERNYLWMTFNSSDNLSGFDCLCVLQNQNWMESGEVERRVMRNELSPEPLSGVPLGGAGAGKIEFCRDGIFRNITVNGNIDTPIRRSESSFFAINAETELGSKTRIAAEESLFGFNPFESMDYRGLYPFSELSCKDRYFPLDVKITSFGSVIPRNIKDSSLPVAFFRISLTSKESVSVTANLVFSMENFLGTGGSPASHDLNAKRFDEGFYELWEQKSGNKEEIWKNGDRQGILFGSGKKEDTRMNGEYVLCTDNPLESTLLSWDFENNGKLISPFIQTGKLPKSKSRKSAGERTASAIHVRKHLKPGETAEIKIVFAWFLPEFRQTTQVDYSHYYCASFNSAEEVAIYAMDNFKRLECQSGEVNNLLSRSALPPWFTEMLCNDSYVFSTNTWLTKDGRFSVNEGPSHMFGCMGTLDQKLYGSHYYSLFFPELDRSELLMFAESQADDGGVQHDLGYGQIDQKGRSHGWPDLSSSLVILSLKHYQMTNDEEYIKKVYKRLCKALLQYQLGLDSDGDFIANISGVGNTFDSESFEGTSAYIATVWLAALLCLEEIAIKMKDKVTADKCRDIYEKAKASAIKELWNGKYFVNYYDTVKKERCGTSHISQVAGELFTNICGLESAYGDSYTRQALDSIFKLNYPPDLLFPTNEATASGKMPRRNLWGWLPHAKSYLGAIPMHYGMGDRAMDALKRMHKVISETNNNNWWDQRLFYEPDTGKQHWGRFYMSSPSTWYAYQSLLGYRIDLPAKKLVLNPNLPEALLPFEGPLFLPDWWSWLKVDKNNRRIDISTIKSFTGKIIIEKMGLPEWEGMVSIAIDGENTDIVRRGNTIEFKKQLNLASVKKIVIKWE